MDTIPLEQLQKLFLDLRSETDWDIDGEMLWGYYFLSPDPDKLMAAGGALADKGYTIVGVFDEDAEDEEGNPVETSLHVLHVERVESHTPESLFARNSELEAFASEYGLDAYDGMDVNPVEEGEDEVEDDDAERQTLENPDLLAAIDALEEGDSELAQASQDALATELQQAVYLIPILGEPVEAEGDKQAVELCFCADEDDKEYLPLFTDVASLRDWSDQPISAMAVHAAEAWNFVLSDEECSGAVINPGSTSLTIPRDDIQALSDELAAIENEEEE